MNKKKILGAVLSGVLALLYFGAVFFLFTFLGITTKDIPLPLFIVIIIFLLIPLFGIVIALMSRIKEINSGEEEEAKKY